MNTIVRYGTTLGIVFAVYGVIVAAAGWFTNSILSFWAVMLAQLFAAVWVLMKTAREGRG